MSCRHYSIEFLKKSFSKTFLFFKIIYRYFAGFLACINNSHYEAIYSRSNPAKRNFIILDWFANARNDESKLYCHYEGNARSNLFSGLPRLLTKSRNDKNFQFDKFQRFLSVIYKKNYYIKGDLNYVKSQNNF